jgi:hypothetical protein
MPIRWWLRSTRRASRGAGYEIARANLGTLIEQRDKAVAEAERLQLEREEAHRFVRDGFAELCKVVEQTTADRLRKVVEQTTAARLRDALDRASLLALEWIDHAIPDAESLGARREVSEMRAANGLASVEVPE